MSRSATISRTTKETSIELSLNIDGTGQANIQTGVGFFDHMLTLLAFHAKWDLTIIAKGDLEVDDHHTVEDIGICLGQALKEALGNKAGIARYGTGRVPMDEALSVVDLDVSGRSYLVYNVKNTRYTIGNYSLEMTVEFLRALCNHAQLTLHVNNLYGSNDHHIQESVFKAFGRACKMAFAVNGNEINSSKGVIE